MPNDDNELVHRGGDERVTGQKTFTTPVISNQNAGFKIKSPSIKKGVNPSSIVAFSYAFDDNEPTVTSYLDNRLGFVNCSVTSEGNVIVGLTATKFVPGSTEQAVLNVHYDSDDSIYATAPSTPLDYGSRTGTQDILTRDWIPRDTRIVHTTGNETIGGDKKFTGAIIQKHPNFDSKQDITTSYFSGITFTDKNDVGWGRILFYANSSAGTRGVDFDITHKASSGYLHFLTTSINASQQITVTIGQNATSFKPSSDNCTLGANQTSQRWKQVYAVSTTISTSDARLKDQISDVPEDILDVWGSIDWVQFKMVDAINKKGESARIHNGLIAQQIDSVFKSKNLDISKYGLFCYDEWEAEQERLDDEGRIASPAVPAGNLYSIRYEEALCMEAAYQRRRASRAEARITELEQRLNSLEEKLVGKD